MLPNRSAVPPVTAYTLFLSPGDPLKTLFLTF